MTIIEPYSLSFIVDDIIGLLVTTRSNGKPDLFFCRKDSS